MRIDQEAEREAAETLALFVSPQNHPNRKAEQPDSVDGGLAGWLAGWTPRPPPPLSLSVQCLRTDEPVSSGGDHRLFQRVTAEATLCGRSSAAVLIRAQVAHSQHIRVRLQPLRNKLLGASRLGSDQIRAPGQAHKVKYRKSALPRPHFEGLCKSSSVRRRLVHCGPLARSGFISSTSLRPRKLQ